jgi:outer membrane receptor for ferrienterochelin and colicins
MRSLLNIFFIVCLHVTAFAQTDTLKEESLSEVIITGQYQPQTLKNSVYQVKVISAERIQQQGATRLQDVLNNELNIRFAQDVATGGANITLNGLSGQNVKVLLDGLPIVGRQGTSNEININQIDINSIERIEIVEGPMSVIYGADALGGVINIITRKKRKDGLHVTARIHEESVGSEYSWFSQGIHNQYLSAVYRRGNWEVGGNVGYNYYGGWKDTAVGRELLWHKKDQILGGVFAGYNNARFNIRYRLDGLDEVIFNPGDFLIRQQATGDTLAYDQEYLTTRLMHQLQSGYTFSPRFSMQTQAAYSTYSRQVYSTTVSKQTGNVRYNNAEGANSLDEFTGFTFRTTGLYKISKNVLLQPGVDINIEQAEGARLTAGTNSVEDYAFFVTSEWAPNEKIRVRPGLRFIKNSIYDAPPVVPSLNIKWSLNKMLDVRLSYANGFRSPSIRELYFNFFDANHQIVGNPDLKAEVSNSFNASLNWKKIVPEKVVYTTVLSGFYNKVKDLIYYAPSVADPNIFMLSNVSDSKTAGVSVQSVAKYKKLNIGIGASYTGFYNASSEEDKSLPDLQWNFEANTSVGYEFTKIGLELNLFYKITGKQPFYAYDANTNGYLEASYDAYHMADLTASKKLGKHLKLNAGIRNLFDVTGVSSQTTATGGVHSNLGSRSLANGRALFAGLIFNMDLLK